MSSNIKRLFTNTCVSIVAVLTVLLLAELAIRIFADKASYQSYDMTDSWMPDDTLGWRHKPHYTSADYVFGKLVRFTTNVDGLRPASLVRKKKQGVKRVLMLGNSTVAGRTVPEQETIHHYLDSLLNLGGNRFEVINAAVEGYATDQAFLHLHRLIAQYQPDYVTYGYCNNDLLANFKRRDAGQNKPRFEWTPEGYFLKQPDKNLRIYKLGAKSKKNRFLSKFALVSYFTPKVYNLKAKVSEELKQVEGVDPAIYANQENYKSEFLLLEYLISEMDKLCKANNAQFFFYAHPDLKATWEPYRKALNVMASPTFCEDVLSDIAQKDGVSFISMVGYFQKHHGRGPFHLLPFDGHCNGEGYRMQAEVLSQAINNNEKL